MTEIGNLKSYSLEALAGEDTLFISAVKEFLEQIYYVESEIGPRNAHEDRANRRVGRLGLTDDERSLAFLAAEAMYCSFFEDINYGHENNSKDEHENNSKERRRLMANFSRLMHDSDIELRIKSANKSAAVLGARRPT